MLFRVEAILAGLRAGSTLEIVLWLDASETRSVALPLVNLAANWDRLADELWPNLRLCGGCVTERIWLGEVL